MTPLGIVLLGAAAFMHAFRALIAEANRDHDNRLADLGTDDETPCRQQCCQPYDQHLAAGDFAAWESEYARGDA